MRLRMLPESCRGRLGRAGSMVNNHAGTLQALAVPPTVMVGALVKHFAAPKDAMLAASIAEEMRVPDVGRLQCAANSTCMVPAPVALPAGFCQRAHPLWGSPLVSCAACHPGRGGGQHAGRAGGGSRCKTAGCAWPPGQAKGPGTSQTVCHTQCCGLP